jgi:hypothetical protein
MCAVISSGKRALQSCGGGSGAVPEEDRQVKINLMMDEEVGAV